MKKITLFVTAMILVSGSAFASKARMASLGNAAHLTTDTQSVFDNIARITQIGDYATYEFGATATNSLGVNTLDSDFNALSAQAGLYPGATGTNGQRIYAANSEGGFVTSLGADQKLGFYIGRKSQFTTLARSIGGFLGQENTVEVMYGSKAGPLAWGTSFNYSASDKKGSATKQKQNAMGVRLGVVAANWDAYALIGLGSTADGATKAGLADADATYRGTTGYKIGGGYWLNTMYLHGNMYQDGAKLEYQATIPGGYAGFVNSKMNVEQRHIEVGVIDTIKSDNSTFFYGVSYNVDTADNKEQTTETSDPYKLEKTSMPFLIGMEVEANSWMTVRGSIKQNILLGEKEYKGADANTTDNNTVANAGVGFKWNKVSLDATIAKALTPASGSTANITVDNFLSNASLTYMF